MLADRIGSDRSTATTVEAGVGRRDGFDDVPRASRSPSRSDHPAGAAAG